MTFSVIFQQPNQRATALRATMSSYFIDLNLGQIIDAITAEWADYDLKPFFYAPVSDIDTIHYRQEVFSDLQNHDLLRHIHIFAEGMRTVRRYLTLSDKLYFHHHKEAWFLRAAAAYCEITKQLNANLQTTRFRSRALRAFDAHLRAYVLSPAFTRLEDETRLLDADLQTVRYCVLIRNGSLTVRRYEQETDYSTEIEQLFERFKQGAAKDYRIVYRESPDMNHIEAKVLEFVARVNPNLFSRLDAYRARHAEFVDKTISYFDREIHFYIAYLEYIGKIAGPGLNFCIPTVEETSKAVHACNAFDLALAQKILKDGGQIVCNSFSLAGRERVIVVTGPNQGGKTTFARMFGQLHYLANLGCPVPGQKAQLIHFDQLFTHFEREEKVESLRGKLEDDLVRIHAILQKATTRSVIVMNEIFTSTTLQDEIFLSTRVMHKILETDLVCVWVTFVDELASFGEQTVSMVSTVVPENPALRTFKVVRRPADGLAYAMAVAAKYKLKYDQIKERLSR